MSTGSFDNVFDVHHNDDMHKNSAITVRLPESLKQRLEAKASASHRSLSAQVLADLEGALDAEVIKEAPCGEGRFLGLFAGRSLPTDGDIEEVRELLWGRLGQSA